MAYISPFDQAVKLLYSTNVPLCIFLTVALIAAGTFLDY